MKRLLIFLLLCSVAFAQDNPYRAINNLNAGTLSMYFQGTIKYVGFNPTDIIAPTF